VVGPKHYSDGMRVIGLFHGITSPVLMPLRLGRSVRRGRRDHRGAVGSRPCRYGSVEGLPVWPNRDPIGELGGVNLYAIVNNAVLDSMDPLGLRAGGGVGGGGFTGGQVCPQGLYGSMGNASDIARYAPGHFEFPEPFHPGKPRKYSPYLFWPPRTWPDPANPGCNCGMWPADPPGWKDGRPLQPPPLTIVGPIPKLPSVPPYSGGGRNAPPARIIGPPALFNEA
jgi:hypothetical protein